MFKVFKIGKKLEIQIYFWAQHFSISVEQNVEYSFDEKAKYFDLYIFFLFESL